MSIFEKTAGGATPRANTEDRVTAIVTAFVSNNTVAKDELPGLINTVRAAITGGAAQSAEPVQKATQAEIRKSITPDALISFIDGRRYKTLKRHLGTHGHTPESYRAAYGLGADYPIVAQNYRERRSEIARALGLGQQRRKEA